MKAFSQINAVTDQSAGVDMIAKGVKCRHSLFRCDLRDPLSLVKEHSIDLHEDPLNVSVCQRLKRRVKIVRATHLSRDQSDTEPLCRTFRFLPIDHDLARDIDQQPDLRRPRNQLQTKRQLFSS